MMLVVTAWCGITAWGKWLHLLCAGQQIGLDLDLFLAGFCTGAVTLWVCGSA
jgi:hypothetical protein